MASQKSLLGKGWTAESLVRAVYFFLSLSLVSALLVRPTKESLESASFARLTFALLAEICSWAALPIVAFLLVFAVKRGANIPRMIGGSLLLAAVSEVPYDLIYARSFADFSSQNPLWAVSISLIVLYSLQILKNQPSLVRYLSISAIIFAAILWLFIFSVGTRFMIAPLGIVLASFVGVFYLLWGMENRMMYSAGFMGTVLFLTPAIGVAILHYRAPLFDVKAEIPSWVNTIFYPILLLIAGVLAKIIGV